MILTQTSQTKIGDATYFWGGWLGLISHPLYFCIWTFWFPQPYESAPLRFFCCVISIPILVRHRWPKKFKPSLSIYWFGFLMFQLPITFSYLTLKNDFSGVWLICETLMIIVLSVIYPRLSLFLSNLLIGVAIAYTFYVYSEGQHYSWQQEHLVYFLSLPIGVVLTMVFSFTIKQEEVAQRNAFITSLAASIAHEMRSPLSQISNVIWLANNQASQQYKPTENYLHHINQVIQNSCQVIDMTMDAINEKPVNKDDFIVLSARAFVTDALECYAYNDLTQADKIAYQALGADFELFADPITLKHVLYNLIDNALYYVKNMADARIELFVLADKRQIVVRDTGPGIAAESMPRIFDSFYTVGKLGGTGLGLPYCKRTMEALDGDIRCESELGQYTAFILSFPQIPQVAVN